MTTTVVVGNPRPASRTRDAGVRLAEGLTGNSPDQVFDLADLGERILAPDDHDVADVVKAVAASSLVVFASPTYKGSYTGLLKSFLDRFAGESGLHGVLAVPLMLGGDLRHSLASDLLLRAVLAELGATCAVPGLFLVDDTYRTDQRLETYAQRWAPIVTAIGKGAQQ